MQTSIATKPEKSISHLGLLHARTGDLLASSRSEDLLPPISTGEAQPPESPAPSTHSLETLKSGPMPGATTDDLVEAIFNDVLTTAAKRRPELPPPRFPPPLEGETNAESSIDDILEKYVREDQ
jgi:hypothetical protein